jgi:hypothetical protein
MFLPIRAIHVTTVTQSRRKLMSENVIDSANTSKPASDTAKHKRKPTKKAKPAKKPNRAKKAAGKLFRKYRVSTDRKASPEGSWRIVPNSFGYF